MITTRTPEGIEVSQVVNGHRLKRHFIGHTEREARQLFARFVKGYLQGVRDAERTKYTRMSEDERRTYTNSDR